LSLAGNNAWPAVRTADGLRDEDPLLAVDAERAALLRPVADGNRPPKGLRLQDVDPRLYRVLRRTILLPCRAARDAAIVVHAVELQPAAGFSGYPDGALDNAVVVKRGRIEERSACPFIERVRGDQIGVRAAARAARRGNTRRGCRATWPSWRTAS